MTQLTSKETINAILKVIYKSENWAASPPEGGCFAHIEEALEWSEKHPGEPIILTVPVTCEGNCAEMIHISAEDGVIRLEEDVNMGPQLEVAQNVDDFTSVATKLLNDITKDCAYEAKPY
ncbi:hypothetical protein [Vibrio owensii]|uniref:hypothetical protein n=1 Tax=Vibrio harveyi group TaxID=717610 RepID=UPI003CC6CFF3